MPRVAVIGSGQNGLIAAHGLLRAGCDVTLYSDRTPDDWLRRSRPTGAASRFDLTLSYERALGLNHWDAEVPEVDGGHITLCTAPRNRLLTVTARLRRPGRTVDVRLQSARWMGDLEQRGGRVVIESVTPARLDEIAGRNDLTLVAAGRADIASLFPRDDARSVYHAPKRNLAMVTFAGGRGAFEGLPFLPVKFEILDGAGEAFFVPFFHKDVRAAGWCVLVEAVPGGPLDRFAAMTSAKEVLDGVRGVLRDFFPWDAPFLDGAAPADENGWLVGRFTPIVRQPAAILPSGRAVMALGDTVVSLDPVGGQGANHGNKMARHIVERVAANPDGPFDVAWMRATFDAFWERHGRVTNAFNNMFLEPPTAAARTLLLAQYGSDGRRSDARQRLADAFVENFNDPQQMTDTFLDLAKTRAFISRTTGMPWPIAVLRGGARVALAQLRQRLGRNPNHPGARDLVPWALPVAPEKRERVQLAS